MATPALRFLRLAAVRAAIANPGERGVMLKILSGVNANKIGRYESGIDTDMITVRLTTPSGQNINFPVQEPITNLQLIDNIPLQEQRGGYRRKAKKSRGRRCRCSRRQTRSNR